MDVDQLLYHYVTDGIANNHRNLVGMELEYPIIALNGGAITLDFVKPMFDSLAPLGFTVSRRASDGTTLAVKDADGHTLTFDTCYENLEFASGSTKTMEEIYRRFRQVLKTVQHTLEPFGLAVAGAGCNPLLRQPHMIESELTLDIAEYFRNNPVQRRFSKDFYCRISSEQVHFNTTVEELPLIFEAFTRLDWLNILLFSDSPMALGDQKFLCVRNELYTQSPFRKIGVAGAQNLGMTTAMDIARSYRDVGLFMRRRNGKLTVFSPVKVSDYFAREDALPEDINCLDLERNIVTTSYGTVEYRILCSQPFTEAFVPSAFNLGLRVRLQDTLEAARAFDRRFQPPEPNERNRQASMGNHPFAPRQDVTALAKELLAISRQGLLERGYGEERFLAPLENRDGILDSPARRLMRAESEQGVKHAFEERTIIGEDIL